MAAGVESDLPALDESARARRKRSADGKGHGRGSWLDLAPLCRMSHPRISSCWLKAHQLIAHRTPRITLCEGGNFDCFSIKMNILFMDFKYFKVD